MNFKKRAKANFEPVTKKSPKSISEPAQYKSLNVSWQIGLIDFHGDWGYWSFSDMIYFELTDELLKKVGDVPEDFGNALCDLANNSFKSIDSFLSKLNRLVKSEISKEQIRIVIAHIKRYYFEEKIFPKLREFEKKNWHEIEGELYFGRGKNKTKHHNIKIASLTKDAQKRLQKLELNDLEVLFSLRLEGDLRIFGIRKFNFLQILWVDQKHDVCKS